MNFITFQVKKDQHWFSPFKILKITKPLKFTLKGFNIDYSDHINKLFGGTASIDVHKDSVRVGIKKTKAENADKYEFFWYVYKNSIRTITPIITTYDLKNVDIIVDTDKITLIVNDQIFLSHQTNKWLTHPYWGGEPAKQLNYFFVETDVEFVNKWQSLWNAVYNYSPLFSNFVISIIILLMAWLVSFKSDTIAILIVFLYIIAGLGFLFRHKLNWQSWALKIRSFITLMQGLIPKK